MPTSRTFTFDYPAKPDQVFALLRDPEFLRRRGEAAGDKNVEIDVHEDGNGVHLRIARDRTLELPAIVRGFVKPTNRAIETTTWRKTGDRWLGEYTLEVTGVPGKVSGKSQLRPSATGTHYESTFEVEARFPIIGRKVEVLMADGFAEQLSLNAERNAAELRTTIDGMQLIGSSNNAE